MKRSELISRITDASDGMLSAEERQQLEYDLQQYPDLLEDYQAIMTLPDPVSIYPVQKNEVFIQKIEELQSQISKKHETHTGFYELSVTWFKQYALAASLLIVALTSVFSLLQPDGELSGSYPFMDELIYPVDESDADAYVLYLDEFTID